MTRRHIGLPLVLMALSVNCLQAATITIGVGSGPGDVPSRIVELDEQDGDFVTNPDGTQNWSGSWTDSDLSVRWSFFLDPDPGVGGSIVVTNNAATPQFFSFETGLPVALAFAAGSEMSGSSSISVSDANFNRVASLTAANGDSVYSGKIDGATQRTLFTDPFSLSVATLGGTNSQSAGFSGESTVTSLPVDGLIQVRNAFLLSPGDSATANSTFVVVPEPSLGMILIGAAACAMGFRRRRR